MSGNFDDDEDEQGDPEPRSEGSQEKKADEEGQREVEGSQTDQKKDDDSKETEQDQDELIKMKVKKPLTSRWKEDCGFQTTREMLHHFIMRAQIPAEHGCVTLVSTGGSRFAYAVTEACKLWGVRTIVATPDRKLAMDLAKEYTSDDNIKKKVSCCCLR